MRWFLSLFRDHAAEKIANDFIENLREQNQRLYVENQRLMRESVIDKAALKTLEKANLKPAKKSRPWPEWMKDADLEAMGIAEKEQ